jgi:predicted alpha/beta-fold hydrolase
MSNKQTAVDWQFEQLFNSFEKFNNSPFTFDEYLKRNLEITQKAKEMEKEQIIDALLFGDVISINTAETYYKQTYGGNK